MNLFDSSALLAFLFAEPGAEIALRELSAGGTCAAVNWSEVAQKVRARGKDWRSNSALLLGFNLAVEPVTVVDAEAAALLWKPGKALSLADRLCLAMADRLGATVWTADAAWGASETVKQIR